MYVGGEVVVIRIHNIHHTTPEESRIVTGG